MFPDVAIILIALTFTAGLYELNSHLFPKVFVASPIERKAEPLERLKKNDCPAHDVVLLVAVDRYPYTATFELVTVVELTGVLHAPLKYDAVIQVEPLLVDIRKVSVVALVDVMKL